VRCCISGPAIRASGWLVIPRWLAIGRRLAVDMQLYEGISLLPGGAFFGHEYCITAGQWTYRIKYRFEGGALLTYFLVHQLWPKSSRADPSWLFSALSWKQHPLFQTFLRSQLF
jgi:hypothetical protein